MAEPSTEITDTADNAKDKKKKTKFGMMMGNMGRSAKKGLSRAGKQMAKGAVKAKQAAVEKIGKVPVSDEDPEIISALERLKITKTEIYAISDIARNLYESRVNEATFLVQLAEKLKGTKVTQNDPFTAYVQQMGVGLSHLEKVQSEHLKRMEEELVLPLERFRDVDVEEVQKLKLKYKNGKTQYDISAHKLTKAQESNDTAKIQAAQQKKDAVYTQLSQLRNDFKFQVNNLEQKKQTNLLQSMEQYWSSYAQFANAQSNILSQNTIEKDIYVPPAMPVQQNANEDMKMDDQMTSNGGIPPPNDDDYNDNNNNNNNNGENVSIMDQYAGTQDEDQYEENQDQNDENNPFSNDDNEPRDDYNPFE